MDHGSSIIVHSTPSRSALKPNLRVITLMYVIFIYCLVFFFPFLIQDSLLLGGGAFGKHFFFLIRVAELNIVPMPVYVVRNLLRMIGRYHIAHRLEVTSM
ncbi:hypothetical protein HOY80DRAFT_983305 [Tuber brumale]|nr:hypothetical protein HOY80DRAFT_983305 [Tuber brumale]